VTGGPERDCFTCGVERTENSPPLPEARSKVLRIIAGVPPRDASPTLANRRGHARLFSLSSLNALAEVGLLRHEPSLAGRKSSAKPIAMRSFRQSLVVHDR
jgi:hypothetical protein